MFWKLLPVVAEGVLRGAANCDRPRVPAAWGADSELAHGMEGALPCCRLAVRAPAAAGECKATAYAEVAKLLQVRAGLPMFCRLGVCTQR